MTARGVPDRGTWVAGVWPTAAGLAPFRGRVRAVRSGAWVVQDESGLYVLVPGTSADWAYTTPRRSPPGAAW